MRTVRPDFAPPRNALILEDELVFADLIHAALRALPTAWSVRRHTHGRAALTDDRRLDLALVDLGIPDIEGLDVIRELHTRNPDMPILVISVIADERKVIEAIKSGACGYILKSDSSMSIAMAIDQVLQGFYPISPRVARYLFQQTRRPEPREIAVGMDTGMGESTLSDAEGLTTREAELLRLFAEGCTYSQVAERMHITLSTVQSHVRSIYRKLGVHSRFHALHQARQRGLVD